MVFGFRVQGLGFRVQGLGFGVTRAPCGSPKLGLQRGSKEYTLDVPTKPFEGLGFGV